MTERSDKLNNQAIVLASGGSYSEAIACFKRAIIIENDNYLLWFNLGLTYRDCGELSNAIMALKKAYYLAPNNAEVLEALATLCLNNKQISDALYYCNEGTELFPDNAKFYNLMGVCFFQESDYDNACECFEMAVTLNPYYEDALFNLKDTYLELDNNYGAQDCKRRLQELQK